MTRYRAFEKADDDTTRWVDFGDQGERVDGGDSCPRGIAILRFLELLHPSEVYGMLALGSQIVIYYEGVLREILVGRY